MPYKIIPGFLNRGIMLKIIAESIDNIRRDGNGTTNIVQTAILTEKLVDVPCGTHGVLVCVDVTYSVKDDGHVSPVTHKYNSIRTFFKL